MKATHKRASMICGTTMAVSLALGLAKLPDGWFEMVCSGLAHVSELVELPWKHASSDENWPERFNPTWRECN